MADPRGPLLLYRLHARTCHPLLPPRKAHVATLTAAGLVEQCRDRWSVGPQVLKGSIRKQFQVDPTRSDEDKTVMREQLQITIKVIDTHGDHHHPHLTQRKEAMDATPQRLTEFLTAYAPALTRRS